MKATKMLKASVSVLIVLALSFTIFSGRLTATAAETGSGGMLAQDIAKAVTAQPLDVQRLRSVLEPLGWGVTPEADGSLTLTPGVCRQRVPPAIHDRMTRQAMALIKEKGYGCLNCHQADSQLRGPSFQEVATRRRCNKWAAELLTYKLSKESTGPYENAHTMQVLAEEDAPTMVEWILSY